MRVSRVLNNNAVMVTTDDGVAIVLGRAIGYGRRPGDTIDKTAISETFVPDRTTSIDRLAALLSDTPLEIVKVAREIAELAHTKLSVRVSQALVLPLADHLSYAVARSRTGVSLDYPLAWEVGQLYPDEMALGRAAVDLVRRRLGADLPDDEAVALAMHIVNAQFSGSGMGPMVEMTTKLNRILSLIEAELGTPIDRDSMAVARFVTHLRYLFVRLHTRVQFQGEAAGILSAVKQSHPEAYHCAERIRFLLTLDDESLSDDEITYLTLHIARLMRTSEEG